MLSVFSLLSGGTVERSVRSDSSPDYFFAAGQSAHFLSQAAFFSQAAAQHFLSQSPFLQQFSLQAAFWQQFFLAGGPLAALRVAGLGLHADFGEALDETFGVVLRCVVDDGHLLAGNVDLDILHSLLEGNVVHDALGAVFAIDVGLEYRRYGRCLFRILRCGRAGAQPQCCHEADEQNLFHTRFVLVLTVNIKLGSTAGRYRTSFQTFLKPPFSKGGSEGLSARFYIGTVNTLNTSSIAGRYRTCVPSAGPTPPTS